MDAIQRSLENKKSGLKKATYWTGILGRLCYFFAVLYFAFVLIEHWQPEIFTVLVQQFFPAEPVPPTISDIEIEIIYNAVLGWWLLRVRDAFQAITEMIEELAETV